MQAVDPLAYLACSACRSPLSPSSSTASSLNLDPHFSLAPCAHILCDRCTPTGDSGQPPACPVCGTEGRLVPLDQATDLQHCFRPLADLTQELGTAAGWQTAHLAEQLDYFKAKCAEQKHTLARVGAELKKVKGLKQQVAQLAAENKSLRDQIALLEQQQQQQQQQQPARHAQQIPAFAQGARQQENHISTIANGPPRGQKRRSLASPDRASLPLRPATHNSTRVHSRSSGSIPSILPLAPSRLSLTPAQQSKTKARRLQALPEEVQGRQATGVSAGSSLRDKLAKYAYDPMRSAAKTPAPGSRMTGRVSATPAAAPSPFRYNAPDEHDHYEQYKQYDDTSQRHQQYVNADAALMPPPPIPHAQWPAPAGRDSYIVPQQQQAGASRPASSFAPAPTPARTASAAPPAAGQPWSTHRQPFRPASSLAQFPPAAAGQGATGGSGRWSGA